MKKAILFIIKNIEEILTSASLIVMVFITFFDTIGRYFFSRPITWGSEMSLFLAVWATFLGMPAAYKRNQHLGMEFFSNKFSIKARLRLQQLITLVLAFLCGMLATVTWQFVMQTNKRTAIMRLSYKYIYAAAAVGFTFMTIYSVIYFYESFFKKEAFRQHFYPDEVTAEKAASLPSKD